MGLFESAARKELRKRMEPIDRFPGNLSDYNSMKGTEYEIIEPDGGLKFVYLPESPATQPELLKKLLAKECVGFIYYKEFTLQYMSVAGGHGVPVRIKHKESKNK